MTTEIRADIVCLWALAISGLVYAQGTQVSPKPRGTDPTASDDFRVSKGQLTFDAEGEEGGAWHSRRPHVPSDTSGLTVGRGYDMKEKTPEKVRTDLVQAGVSETTAKLYAKAAGLEGDEARQFIAKNALPEITPAQQKALFGRAYAEMERDVRRLADKADVVKEYGRVNWDRLDPAIYEALVDLRFRGDYTLATRKKLQKYVVANDLKGFTEAMSDMDLWKNVPRDRFRRRLQAVENAVEARGTRERLIGEAKGAEKGLRKQVREGAEEAAERPSRTTSCAGPARRPGGPKKSGSGWRKS